jgi:hypothetical protein
MNLVISKSDNHDVFGLIKIGQMVKDNMLESDNLLLNLGKNIES